VIAAGVICRAHTFDLITEDMERCEQSGEYRVVIESDCATKTTREVCAEHLHKLRRGVTKCIDGQHVVRLITAARVGGAE
jgi:hypothetical protein